MTTVVEGKGIMYPIIRVILAAVVFLAGSPSASFAEKNVVTAEGRYVMGDLDSKRDAKALALLEAKRLALEKTGTYMESLSAVRDFQLTKDQIHSLAAGILSVEVLKEDWKTSGENMVVVITIRATVDTSNLKPRIAALQEGQESDHFKEIRGQLAALQKELVDLKAQQQTAGKQKSTPEREASEKHRNIIRKMSALDHLEGGNAALAVQRWEDAADSYRRALAVDPALVDAYAGISIALLRKGETEKAFEAVNKALTLDPQSPRSHTAKAIILMNRRMGREALASINRAIELDPRHPRQYLIRGDIRRKLGNREQALQDFDRACEMRLPRACQSADMLRQRPKSRFDSEGVPMPVRPGDRPPRRPMPRTE